MLEVPAFYQAYIGVSSRGLPNKRITEPRPPKAGPTTPLVDSTKPQRHFPLGLELLRTLDLMLHPPAATVRALERARVTCRLSIFGPTRPDSVSAAEIHYLQPTHSVEL